MSGIATCSLGNIADGVVATITIIVTAWGTSIVTNMAQVSSSAPDPVPTNKTDTDTTVLHVNLDWLPIWAKFKLRWQIFDAALVRIAS